MAFTRKDSRNSCGFDSAITAYLTVKMILISVFGREILPIPHIFVKKLVMVLPFVILQLICGTM